MIVQILIFIAGIIFLLGGIIGCVVPVIPGPILSFLALILISLPSRFSLYSPWLLVILAAAAILSQFLDNLFPVLASKKAGAGKPGIWGSIIGMIAGTLLFPPFGVFIGAFLGALAGEMAFNKENETPLKSALGVFTGTLLGILVKLSISGIIAWFFFTRLDSYFS